MGDHMRLITKQLAKLEEQRQTKCVPKLPSVRPGAARVPERRQRGAADQQRRHEIAHRRLGQPLPRIAPGRKSHVFNPGQKAVFDAEEQRFHKYVPSHAALQLPMLPVMAQMEYREGRRVEKNEWFAHLLHV